MILYIYFFQNKCGNERFSASRLLLEYLEQTTIGYYILKSALRRTNQQGLVDFIESALEDIKSVLFYPQEWWFYDVSNVLRRG